MTYYCKGCRKNRSEEQFTGMNKSCDCCIERARKYKEENYEKEVARYARFRDEHRERLNQKRREKREDEEYRNKERERAKELGREVYKCEVCNCEMKKWNKRRHEKTDKHRANQNGGNQIGQVRQCLPLTVIYVELCQ